MERTKELWKKEGSLFTGLGEVLFDMLPEGPRLGGAPANFAWTVHALGGRALVVSAVGDDELGREAAALLAEKELPAELFTVPQERAMWTCPSTPEGPVVPLRGGPGLRGAPLDGTHGQGGGAYGGVLLRHACPVRRGDPGYGGAVSSGHAGGELPGV